MPLKGDFSELSGFLKKLQKLPDASREIAIKFAPRTAALVGETMAAQESPYGDPWTPTKSGAPAFGGASALGYVLTRLVGKNAVRTTVLYPLHFHQDGTHKVGRKRGRVIARKVLGGALKSLGLKAGGAPRQKKGESDEAYARRLTAFNAQKELRKRAERELKGSAQAAVDAAREAGGWHDPPRPLIPDDAQGIPALWNDAIQEIARDVMGALGAEER